MYDKFEITEEEIRLLRSKFPTSKVSNKSRYPYQRMNRLGELLSDIVMPDKKIWQLFL